MTELALPAGNLETALVAFKEGADAVYFGLREFSARKGAVNFSLEDLSKIRRYALDNGKKIYVTVNTLLSDSDIERVLPLLDALAFYGNDGVIVQDLGLVEIIRKYYPTLKLHGSTQMAVHTVEGVKELQRLGFERVVLSRELTFDEIKAIRKACPDIELKVFIHGALCYGFSGLCFASYNKCGRSANRGECAQICRSWFINEKTKEKGYFFSMEDLCIKEELKALRDISIDSVKVEGRLKSPEYTAACARYYRAVLDDKEIKEEDEERLYSTFLRKSGDGYLRYRKNRESLLSADYPGHMGLRLGKVVEERGSSCFLETDKTLESHDGIQYFIKDNSNLTTPVKSSAVVKAKTPGGYILLKESKQSLLGKEIYKISDSTRREKTPSVNIPPYRKGVEISVNLYDDRLEGTILNKKTVVAVKIEESNKKNDIRPLLEKTLFESGDSPYTLSSLDYHNYSSLSFPFIPPSALKSFRRALYSSVQNIEFKTPTINEPVQRDVSFILPERKELDGDLPWSLEGKRTGERTYFTFPPVTFNEEKLWRDMLDAVKGCERPTIGLNNISQVRFAVLHPEYDYFVDVFLYLSNRFALSLLLEECPSIKAGYLWIERERGDIAWPFEPTVTHYEMPHFISRTCFRHDALKEPCTGCRGKDDYSVSQNGEKYSVLVRGCMTVMRREREEG